MDDNSSQIDQRLLKAYQNTIYRVEKPRMELQIGVKNEELNVFCFDNNVHSWAFISGHNPQSQPLSARENELRHQQLIEKVRAGQWRYCEGLGIGQGGDWPPEVSLFILDISKKEAVRLGQQFEQNAIVFGKFNQSPELFWINGRREC